MEQSNGYWADFRYYKNGYLAYYRNSDGYEEAHSPNGKRVWTQ